ncbi:MAG TPA: nuclear transport factor 2 family protein [Caulobacteraceae bacterium]|nr:nuclear transport factor 2 family protein [Caulobacteraceae bacterium]
MSDAEARLRAFEDRLALEDLISTYALLVARGDGPGVVDLFSDDGEFIGLTHTVSGRQALLTFYIGAARSGAIVPFVANKVFTISGDTARGASTLVALSPPPGRQLLCGAYDDDFVRTAEGWRFRRRRFITHFES